MVQIRNVPDDLHKRLKTRAAMEGLSLSDYLLYELRRMTDRPTMAELLQRLQSRSIVKTKLSPADAIRAERDAR
ncbi:MAG: FitA-like ribbon-helix-helix domain-containing protein [Planctomycetota bacterium]